MVSRAQVQQVHDTERTTDSITVIRREQSRRPLLDTDVHSTSMMTHRVYRHIARVAGTLYQWSSSVVVLIGTAIAVRGRDAVSGTDSITNTLPINFTVPCAATVSNTEANLIF